MEMTLEFPGGKESTIDVIEAHDIIRDIQTRLDTNDRVKTAVEFRPWIAERLELDEKALAMNQVAALVEVLVRDGNAFHESLKKKD